MKTLVDPILSDADFQRVSDMVYRHCGIDLRDDKKQLVKARVSRRLRSLGIDSIGDYLDLVAADASGEEFTLLIDAISTNLTSFYREPDHFRYLAEAAIPELLEPKRAAGDRRIRLWSAACSTGEEAYTLGMILLESVPDAPRWDIKVLATDISTQVLKTARVGFYGAERLEPLPKKFQSRFFRKGDLGGQAGFCVSPELRQLIAFRHLNLVDVWPFAGPFDFVFCRNVMIYFDKITQEKLVNRLWEVVAPGGMLFTGHSESLTGVRHRFTSVRPTVYVKN